MYCSGCYAAWKSLLNAELAERHPLPTLNDWTGPVRDGTRARQSVQLPPGHRRPTPPGDRCCRIESRCLRPPAPPGLGPWMVGPARWRSGVSESARHAAASGMSARQLQCEH